MQSADLALRLAQRAFSALNEARADLSPLTRAQRCHALRRSLSALSADDRDRFARWLALLRTSRQADAVRRAVAIVPVDAIVRRMPRRAQAA